MTPFLAIAPFMTPFRDFIKNPAGSKVFWDEQLWLILGQAEETICQLAKDELSH